MTPVLPHRFLFRCEFSVPRVAGLPRRKGNRILELPEACVLPNLGPLDASTRPAAPRQPGPWQIGASGAWTDDATYTAKLWWHETPFARTLTCRFAGDRLTVEYAPNAGFGPLDPTQLEARAQA